jgi:hypothetical protein
MTRTSVRLAVTMAFLLQGPRGNASMQEDPLTQPQPQRQLDIDVLDANQPAVERTEEEIHEEAKRIAAETAKEPERQGDILGLSDVTPDVEIPR